MKKTYINPEMEVVELNMTSTLLAGSVLGESVLNNMADESAVGLSPEMNVGDIFQEDNNISFME